MTFSPPNKTRTLWQLRIAAVFVLLFLAVFFVFGFTLTSLFINTAIFALELIFLAWYIPKYLKNYKICICHSNISIYRGVLFKSIYIMPFPRLVFAQSFETPFASIMRLKGITLKAARGRLMIPELNNVDAEYLLDNIRERKNV